MNSTNSSAFTNSSATPVVEQIEVPAPRKASKADKQAQYLMVSAPTAVVPRTKKSAQAKAPLPEGVVSFDDDEPEVAEESDGSEVSDDEGENLEKAKAKPQAEDAYDMDLFDNPTTSLPVIPKPRKPNPAAALPDQEIFETSKKLKQYYIVVPCKLRLVVLAAFVRWKLAEQAKSIVFMTSRELVSFHQRILSVDLSKWYVFSLALS